MEGSAKRRLPPGSHGIPADVVTRNQRERLVAAMAEACAEVGYEGVTATAVARGAGVSTATFYKQFADKQSCMLAAHEQLVDRLLEEVDRAAEAHDDSVGRSRAALRTVLALLGADAPSARLLSIEILAAGQAGSERHAAVVRALGVRLRGGKLVQGEDPPALDEAEWAKAAGVLALIGRRAVAGEAARLPELEDELATLF